MKLKGKRVLITGGAKRVGRALALHLGHLGMHVAIHYGRSADEAADTVARLRSLRVEAAAFQADFNAGAATATALIERVAGEFGPLDVLVNSAAAWVPGTLAATDEANWDQHFNVNLKTPFFLIQAFAAQCANRPGAVVNLVDYQSERNATTHMAYLLAKGGLAQLTGMAARALGPSIRVNALSLGAILPADDHDNGAWEALRQRTPTQRLGAPTDVAAALEFVLRQDYINGVVLPVSGGEHLLGAE